jgi:hypothetical protein
MTNDAIDELLRELHEYVYSLDEEYGLPQYGKKAKAGMRSIVAQWAAGQRHQAIVTLNGYQLQAALDFIAPDGEAEQLESDVSIQYAEAENGHSGAGYYCCITEYPEEGSILLPTEPPCTSPSSAP